MSPPALRVEEDPEAGPAVAHLVLCRPEAYNAITPGLRDELAAALDDAGGDERVRVVLLRAEGPAFCAGFGLDWSTAAPAGGDGTRRVWDSVADLAMISTFGEAFARLHRVPVPTIAAVQGWCIAGGTDLVLHADLIVCDETAVFGYPPARVWGIPEAPWVWVARLGLEQAKRYLFTGDEIPGPEAARLGMVTECVAEGELDGRARELAGRMALLPRNQLKMMKLALNEVAAHQYQPASSQLLGQLFDGIARNTQEGLDFVERARQVGWRQAVRERDAPFGDYGSRPEVS